jgi:hypothetical protein
MLRSRLPTLVAPLLVLGSIPLAATAAHAQAKDQVTRPIEVLVVARDQEPRCEPQELRVPAEANIDLRVQNQGTKSVAVRAPDLFREDSVRTVTGATAEQGKRGYVVDANGQAQWIVLTPGRGRYEFTCADPAGNMAEMKGTLTAVR